MRVSSIGRAPRWTSRVDGSSARSAKRSAPPSSARPGAAQERAQARVQLAQGEGLDEVVVGARVEARDAVVDGVARGEQEHRHALARGPQPAGHLEPVDARHGDVEHHGVGPALGQRVERRAPVGGHLDVVALQAQRPVQGRPDGGFVVDDQDAHRGRLWQGEPKGR